METWKRVRHDSGPSGEERDEVELFRKDEVESPWRRSFNRDYRGHLPFKES